MDVPLDQFWSLEIKFVFNKCLNSIKIHTDDLISLLCFIGEFTEVIEHNSFNQTTCRLTHQSHVLRYLVRMHPIRNDTIDFMRVTFDRYWLIPLQTFEASSYWVLKKELNTFIWKQWCHWIKYDWIEYNSHLLLY